MSAWSEFWFDCLDWFAENVLVPIMFVLLLGLVAFIGIACYEAYNEDPISSGVVVGKLHHDAYSSIMPVGKVMVPQYHPERWSLEIQGLTRHGKLAKREFDVTESQWKSIETGTEMKLE